MDQTIVFSGRIRKGSSPAEVRENFSRIFKLEDPRQLDRFFSGKPVVIRRGLSPEEARKYEQFLFKAGALCEIRPSDRSEPDAKAPVLKRAEAGSRPARPQLFALSNGMASAAALPVPMAEGFRPQRWQLLALLLLACLALLFDLQQMGILPSDLSMLYRSHGNPEPAAVNQLQQAQAQLAISRLAASPNPGAERDAARQQIINAAATQREKDNLRRLYQVIDQSAASRSAAAK